MNDTIYLIGFMASGKTTLGRALADILPEYRFVDLDESIEDAEGMTVNDIFSLRGEEFFRRRESELLRGLSAPGVIMACGGGTPCHRGNMDFMLGTGTVVWLVADDDVTIRRLHLTRGGRPLIDSMLDDPAALRSHIASLNERRYPYYSRAHHVFDSNRLEDKNQIDLSCQQFINKLLR